MHPSTTTGDCQPSAGASPFSHLTSAIVYDDVLVHIDDAYPYVGLKRSAIHYRMSPKSQYYDPRFPAPAPRAGRKTFFYRRDLVAYVRLFAQDAA